MSRSRVLLTSLSERTSAKGRRYLSGWLGSAGWGYTVGRNIGYGYVRDPEGVDAAYVLSGTYELEVAGERIPATPFLKPLYDPSMARVKV